MSVSPTSSVGSATGLVGSLMEGAAKADPASHCVACNSTERVSIHYNALSCHGCKAFFRRTVFERRKYYCSAEGKCEITDENRNQCRACRFEKCVRGGMNPKHVREERAKRRPHDGGSEQEIETKIVLVEEHSITLRLLELERVTESGGRASMGLERDQLRRLIIHEFSIPDTDVSNMNYRCERVMEDADLTDAYYRSFLLLSEWAGELAEFRLLTQQDQMLLFRQNFMMFGWLHFVYRTVTLRQERIGVSLGNGAFLPYSEEGRQQLAPKWAATYGHVGVKLIEMVVTPMLELAVDLEEYTLLKTMALFQTDNQLSPQGIALVSQMRDLLLAALVAHIDRRFPLLNSSQRAQRCLKLTLLFPALMAIRGDIERVRTTEQLLASLLTLDAFKLAPATAAAFSMADFSGVAASLFTAAMPGAGVVDMPPWPTATATPYSFS